MIKAIFELKKDNSFHVTYSASATSTTSINLSLNLYLNLAGHVRRHSKAHRFQLNAFSTPNSLILGSKTHRVVQTHFHSQRR